MAEPEHNALVAAYAEQAEDLIEDMRDHDIWRSLLSGKNRRDFAGVAAMIAADRYAAGSSAARAAVYILITHGIQAARDFAADLEHHES